MPLAPQTTPSELCLGPFKQGVVLSPSTPAPGELGRLWLASAPAADTAKLQDVLAEIPVGYDVGELVLHHVLVDDHVVRFDGVGDVEEDVLQ